VRQCPSEAAWVTSVKALFGTFPELLLTLCAGSSKHCAVSGKVLRILDKLCESSCEVLSQFLGTVCDNASSSCVFSYLHGSTGSFVS